MEICKWRSETWREDRLTGLKFDWRVLLRIPEGGFVDVGKEMPFTASATGSSPEFDINLPKKQPDLGDRRDKEDVLCVWNDVCQRRESATGLPTRRMEVDA